MQSAELDAGSIDFRAARDHVDRVVAASGTSFLWGMRALPRDRREAMFAIYAFCREVDDVADEAPDVETGRAGLEEWRTEMDRLYAGRPTHPTTLAVAPAVEAFELPRDAFLAVIDGMEMDLDGRMIAPSDDELTLYCSRVAGAVGRLSVRVFGAPQPTGDQLAERLGLAMQLTNILRDLAEDASLGRLYLPAELLREHGITTHDPGAVLAHPALPAVCRMLADRAEEAFVESRDLAAVCGARTRRATSVMAEVYHRLLRRLVASDWRTPHRRISISKVEKIRVFLLHGLA